MRDVPLVSLLVPAFNRADLVGECIESALNQTFSDLEVVVVDGASTDATWEVCQRYAAKDHRVRAIREDVNGGPVAGWARCLAEARGTYGTFLWSDDLLMPTFVERTLPLVREPDIAFAFTAAEIGTAPGLGTVHYGRPGGRILTAHYVRTTIDDPGANPVSPACALFRLEDLRAAFTPSLATKPPTDLAWTGAGTDLLFYLRTAVRYPFVAAIGDPLAFFRAHPGSISVDGRGGVVRLHYAMSRAWFSRERGDARASRMALARDWLADMRSRRSFVAPWTAARRYAGLISAAGLAIGAAELAGRVALRRAAP